MSICIWWHAHCTERYISVVRERKVGNEKSSSVVGGEVRLTVNCFIAVATSEVIHSVDHSIAFRCLCRINLSSEVLLSVRPCKCNVGSECAPFLSSQWYEIEASFQEVKGSMIVPEPVVGGCTDASKRVIVFA